MIIGIDNGNANTKTVHTTFTSGITRHDLKPPMADELLEYYTPEQLRMHFMSLGLSSKSVGFKPQVYMPEEERKFSIQEQINVEVFVDKAINSIDLISHDETTIYLNIPVEVEVGKYYSISQKIRIE